MFRSIKEVTVVEQLPKLAKDLGSRRWIVSAKLKKFGIATHTATQVMEISEQGVVCETKHGERPILEADTVVLSLGSTPDDSLYQALTEAGGDKKIVAVGDCVKPQKIPEAIESGFLAACAVEG
jgi:2,4-dienoyl-CoA reductase (NADPH2)